MKLLQIAFSGCFIIHIQTGIAIADDYSDTFTKALTQGEVKASVRYRYEGVNDDGNTLDKAKASTIRTRIGYGTKNFHGLSVYAEMEDIREVGNKKYNDGPGPADKYDLKYDTVADPEETELNQAYIQFVHAYKDSSLLIRHGRQRQKWDNDRFIGNVGWRQNEQTYDATHIQLESKKNGLRAMYSHQTNVNRIFGNQAGTAGDFNVSNHNFNVNYSGLKYLDATGYYYLWESDEPATNSGGFNQDDSRKTIGLRLKSKFPVSDSITILGTGEYASQSDYKDADNFGSLAYTLLEAGFSFKTHIENLAPITIIAGLEKLEGSIDDGESFITPFATLHTFHGRADVFAGANTTGVYGPAGTAGIEDMYFSIGTRFFGTKMMAVYHQYEAEDDDSAISGYGDEINLLAVKAFGKHYAIGAAYSDFNGDNDFRKDTKKFWLWSEINF